MRLAPPHWLWIAVIATLLTAMAAAAETGGAAIARPSGSQIP